MTVILHGMVRSVALTDRRVWEIKKWDFLFYFTQEQSHMTSEVRLEPVLYATWSAFRKAVGKTQSAEFCRQMTVTLCDKTTDVRAFWDATVDDKTTAAILSYQTVVALQKSFPDEFGPLGWNAAACMLEGLEEWTDHWCGYMLRMTGRSRRTLVDVLRNMWKGIQEDTVHTTESGLVCVVLLRELHAHVVRVRTTFEERVGMQMKYVGTMLALHLSVYAPTREFAVTLAAVLGLVVTGYDEDGDAIVGIRAGLSSKGQTGTGNMLRCMCLGLTDVHHDVLVEAGRALDPVTDARVVLGRCFDLSPRLKGYVRAYASDAICEFARAVLVVVGMWMRGERREFRFQQCVANVVANVRAGEISPALFRGDLAIAMAAVLFEHGLPARVYDLLDLLVEDPCDAYGEELDAYVTALQP